MTKIIAGFLLLFSLQAFGSGFLMPSNPPPAVTLAWDAPTNQVEASFNLYYGVASRSYTNEVGTTNTQCTVSNLVFGTTYYFAATCVASNGLESPFSVELTYATPIVPLAPTMLPPVTLVVQSTPIGGAVWQDSGMFWSLSPSATNSLFRLKLVRSK